ncbi:M23 family metallopeptidase, partial [Alteromonas marina]|uniref:M23 family metallopeptidase n=1 Tax=Alteromonas marina TaxID=203795 RepID=UPI0012EBA3AA
MNYILRITLLGKQISICSILIALFLTSTPQASELPENTQVLIEQLANDPLIEKFAIIDNLNNPLSRAEVAILVDRTLVNLAPIFDVDIDGKNVRFPDVNPNADYYPSVVRLTNYYGRNDRAVFTSDNILFRPLDHTSRKEFITVALEGFNVELTNTSNLAAFDDYSSIKGDWSEIYFSTAVTLGVIKGNNNSLFPDEKISIFEAMVVLGNLNALYSQAPLHDSSGFSFDTAFLSYPQKKLGQPFKANFNEDSQPFTINTIVIDSLSNADELCGSKNAILLGVDSTYDTSQSLAEKVAPYFWWEAKEGYLSAISTSSNFEQVCFYPPSATPIQGNLVTVSGNDNLGNISSYSTSISADNFSFDKLNDAERASEALLNIAPFEFVIAGKTLTLDLRSSAVLKGNLDIGIENVFVTAYFDDGFSTNFTASLVNDHLDINVPVLTQYYGQNIELAISLRVQNVRNTQRISAVYIPEYKVIGRVNNNTGESATHVKLGDQSVVLSTNNYFEIPVLFDVENAPLILTATGGSTSNTFPEIEVLLTYTNPIQFIDLIGSDISETLDSDGDGLSDALEDILLTDKNNADSDGDGIPDGWEYDNGLNPLDSDDAQQDDDYDGLSNFEEYNLNTNPVNNDSDNDGFDDATEASSGSDPLQITSTPLSNLQVCDSEVTLTPLKAIACTLFGKLANELDDPVLGVNYNYNNWGDNPHLYPNNSGHAGIDMQTKNVAGGNVSSHLVPFYSLSSGKVIAAEKNATYNRVVIYDDARNISFIYLHAHSVDVTVGQKVKVGDKLGIQGATGAGNAWHVHLEARAGQTIYASLNKDNTLNPIASVLPYIIEHIQNPPLEVAEYRLVGPSSVLENESASFSFLAIYTNGTSEEVTPDSWEVTDNNNGSSFGANGLFTAGPVNLDKTINAKVSLLDKSITFKIAILDSAQNAAPTETIILKSQQEECGNGQAVEVSIFRPSGIACSYKDENGVTKNTVIKQLSLHVKANLVLQSGTIDLEGETIVVDGDFIQQGGIVYVKNGSLIVKGDYRLQ